MPPKHESIDLVIRLSDYEIALTARGCSGVFTILTQLWDEEVSIYWVQILNSGLELSEDILQELRYLPDSAACSCLSTLLYD
jgi:hypothetical protein